MMNRLRFACFAAALATATPARPETIRASSTTIIQGRQDYQDGKLVDQVPVYEIIDIAASDIRTGFTDDFQIVLSTWGSVDLATQRFWQNGAPVSNRWSGDVNVGYVRADFLGRSLTLRAGREMVADGTARMIQIDGGDLRLLLPGGFGLSAYAGSPVAPRFYKSGNEMNVGNNAGATLATGGRVFWAYPGLLEVGASVGLAWDRDEINRQDLGVDFRLTPHHMIALVGSGWFSLYEGRIGEGSVGVVVTPISHLDVKVDYRHVEPDLFLSRFSVLSVFASDKRNDVGGSVHWAPIREFALDGDYHALLEEAGTGHWGRARFTMHPGGPSSSFGIEGGILKAVENGYENLRAFGAKSWGALAATLDLYGYFYDQRVNGQYSSLQATGTVGYEFARGWRALVAGTAGSTPYLERQLEIMAKLVYDQTYIAREVR